MIAPFLPPAVQAPLYEPLLITGTAGSLGRELVQHLSDQTSVVALDIDEMRIWQLEQHNRERIQIHLTDICNAAELESVFRRARPAIVIHLAALKHVPLGNRFPDRFYTVNVKGTQNVLEAAIGAGVNHFIHISTDKVTSEISEYGRTKRRAEELVLAHSGNFQTTQILRLVNVAGTRGSVLDVWQQQGVEGKPLTIRGEGTERLFVHMNDVIAMISKLFQIKRSGTYIPAQYHTIKIRDLAQSIAEQYEVPIHQADLLPGESTSEKLFFPNEHITENLAGILNRIEKHFPIPDRNLSSNKKHSSL